jgi:hypothetical protein
MAGLAPGSARLVFADPPYRQGISYGPHFNDNTPEPEYLAWSQEWIHRAARLLTADGLLWLLVNHELACQLVPIALGAGLAARPDRFGRWPASETMVDVV